MLQTNESNALEKDFDRTGKLMTPLKRKYDLWSCTVCLLLEAEFVLGTSTMVIYHRMLNMYKM